jgi:hypothetical protein
VKSPGRSRRTWVSSKRRVLVSNRPDYDRFLGPQPLDPFLTSANTRQKSSKKPPPPASYSRCQIPELKDEFSV